MVVIGRLFDVVGVAVGDRILLIPASVACGLTLAGTGAFFIIHFETQPIFIYICNVNSTIYININLNTNFLWN